MSLFPLFVSGLLKGAAQAGQSPGASPLPGSPTGSPTGSPVGSPTDGGGDGGSPSAAGNGTLFWTAPEVASLTQGFISQFALTTAWDVDTITTEGSPDPKLLAPGGSTNEVAWPHVTANGEHLYFVQIDEGTRGFLYHYTLSTPYDITTAVFSEKLDVDTLDKFRAEDDSSNGIYVKPDGTRIYLIMETDDFLIQYDLTTPYDLSTLVQGSPDEFYDYGGTFLTMEDLTFSPDGLQVLMLSSIATVYLGEMNTAWDVTTIFNFFEVVDMGVDGGDSGKGIHYRSNALEVFIFAEDTGTSEFFLFEYNLEQAYNFEEIAFNKRGAFVFNNDSGSQYEPRGLSFRDDQSQSPVFILVENSGAETGNLSGWNVTKGNWSTSIQEYQGTVAFEGQDPSGGTEDYNVAYQNVDLVAEGVSTSDIDAGLVKFLLTWYQANSFSGDIGGMGFRFYDGESPEGQIEADVISDFVEITPEDTYEKRALEARIPPGTRVVRLFMFSVLKVGSNANTLIDRIRTTVQYDNLPTEETRKRARVAFRNTPATPAPGYNVSDGTDIANLVDQDDNPSGWFLNVTSGFSFPSDSGGEPYSPLIPVTFPWAQGYVVADNSQIVFDNLDPSKTYDLEVFGSRDSSPQRRLTVSVQGQGSPSKEGTIESAFNVEGVIRLTNLVPDEGSPGVAALTVDFTTPDSFGYLNHIVLYEN